jgi:hypothetical protein
MRPSVPWLSARTTLDGCGRARPGWTLAAAGALTTALAAHPGTAITALTRYFPPAVDRAYHAMGQPIAQPAQQGALPTLRAATDPGARGGEYYGPDGWLEFKGYPHRVSSSALA